MVSLIVKNIIEEDFGCEGRPDGQKPKCKVILRDFNGNEMDVFIDDEELYAQMESVAYRLTEYHSTGKLLTDDKAPVELLGMSMIDGLIDRIEDELGEEATVVATGGLSKEIIQHCTRNIIYNENLLLDGLRIIYERNN